MRRARFRSLLVRFGLIVALCVVSGVVFGGEVGSLAGEPDGDGFDASAVPTGPEVRILTDAYEWPCYPDDYVYTVPAAGGTVSAAALCPSAKAEGSVGRPISTVRGTFEVHGWDLFASAETGYGVQDEGEFAETDSSFGDIVEILPGNSGLAVGDLASVYVTVDIDADSAGTVEDDWAVTVFAKKIEGDQLVDVDMHCVSSSDDLCVASAYELGHGPHQMKWTVTITARVGDRLSIGGAVWAFSYSTGPTDPGGFGTLDTSWSICPGKYTTLATDSGWNGECAPFGTFVDDDGNPHEPMIEAIADAGITNGCATDPPMYCPADIVTRAEMAAFLLRADGESPRATYAGYFVDVPSDAWYAGHVERLYELGLTTGCDTDPLRFCPTAGVLRSEMAAFLIRLLGEEGNLPKLQGYFVDVPADAWFRPYVEHLYDLDVTKGCATSPARFCPFSPVLRDQMASFLARALGLSPITPLPW